jgi:hypothetical protein
LTNSKLTICGDHTADVGQYACSIAHCVRATNGSGIQGRRKWQKQSATEQKTGDLPVRPIKKLFHGFS